MNIQISRYTTRTIVQNVRPGGIAQDEANRESRTLGAGITPFVAPVEARHRVFR